MKSEEDGRVMRAWHGDYTLQHNLLHGLKVADAESTLTGAVALKYIEENFNRHPLEPGIRFVVGP